MKIDILSKSSHSYSIPLTTITTELVLKVGQPLLIVLTPYSLRNKWRRDRKGILTLHFNGSIDWNSDHLNSNEPNLTKPTELSKEYFKQALRDDWDAFFAYSGERDRSWYEIDFGRDWKYEADRVIIPVNSCDFRLGY